jgi:hypothetical protein
MLTYIIADSSVMFCDFHREKAWSRWIRANVSLEKRSTVKVLLGAIADAATIREMEEAYAQMSGHEFCQANLKQWFDTHWWNHKEVPKINHKFVQACYFNCLDVHFSVGFAFFD